ncbi:PE-PPE domain-containing protein [Williamsia maris]|uniref:PE-PPE domain-containing protein n=1 Tax=Williamsia maris TaxID=72806 RepID=A0ABT1H851_9NOCA|nr:PE-PPE domain-containing protein [Williamsia maris]MCP2174354.1 PE-PPE domain-containing protein [Williamsia maris]
MRILQARLALAVLSVSIPAVLVLFQADVASAADTQHSTCPTSGKVFIVDGTNDDPSNYHTREIAGRYPGYDVEHVNYPATVWPLGATSYAASAAAGRTAVHDGVVSYRATSGCAESPVVIVGYSQGAAIAGDELHALATDPHSSVATRDSQGAPIVSGELYSDPRRTGDARGRGVELSMIGVIPGLGMRGPRGPGGYGDIPVLDVCVDGDPICDLPDPLHDPLGAIDALLGFGTKHFEYGQYMADPTALGHGAMPTGSVLMARPTALSILLAGVGVHALDGVPTFYIPLGYPELARFAPVVAFFQARGLQYPDLGHGATLPDLLTIGTALRGDPASQARLLVSLRGIARFPVRFVADWTAVVRDRVVGDVPATAPVQGPAANADPPTTPMPPEVTSNVDPSPATPRPTTPPPSSTPTGPLRTAVQHRLGEVLTRFRPSPAPSSSAKPSPSSATPDRTTNTPSPTSHPDQSSTTHDSDTGAAAAS